MHKQLQTLGYNLSMNYYRVSGNEFWAEFGQDSNV
jgi:hypothetical protein